MPTTRNEPTLGPPPALYTVTHLFGVVPRRSTPRYLPLLVSRHDVAGVVRVAWGPFTPERAVRAVFGHNHAFGGLPPRMRIAGKLTSAVQHTLCYALQATEMRAVRTVSGCRPLASELKAAALTADGETVAATRFAVERWAASQGDAARLPAARPFDEEAIPAHSLRAVELWGNRAVIDLDGERHEVPLERLGLIVEVIAYVRRAVFVMGNVREGRIRPRRPPEL